MSAEITLADAFTGLTVTAPIRVARMCETCSGDGAAPGTSRTTCDVCGGAGRVQQVSQNVFGQFVRTGTCPRCEGSGRIVESPCPTCEGIGRTLQNRALEIDVPAGIADGQRIRVRSEGHAGDLGGPPGDVFLQVRVTPEQGIERDGADLHTVVRRDHDTGGARDLGQRRWAAAGTVDVEIPPGTQPGEVHVLRGEGMPVLDGRRRGNFHVHTRVHIPRRLDDSQRTMLEQLDDTLGADPYHDDEHGGFFRRLKNAFR